MLLRAFLGFPPRLSPEESSPQLILEKASENVKGAIVALGVEIVALTAAIPVTLWT